LDARYLAAAHAALMFADASSSAMDRCQVASVTVVIRMQRPGKNREQKKTAPEGAVSLHLFLCLFNLSQDSQDVLT